MATYAVTVCLEVAGNLDDDAVDRLLTAVTPYSGAIGHTELLEPTVVDLVLDIEAEDPAVAAIEGLRAARAVLASAGLPAGGETTGIRVQTVLDQDRAAAVPQLLGLTEVGHLLGVTRQRVTQLRTRPDFPEPIAALASGPVWTEPSLRHFVAGWDRTPGGRSRAAHAR